MATPASCYLAPANLQCACQAAPWKGGAEERGQIEAARRLIDAMPRQHPFNLRYTAVEKVDWESCAEALSAAEKRRVLTGGVVKASADAILIAHTTPGGDTEALARELLAVGRRVLTLAHPANVGLVAMGAGRFA